MPRLRAIYRFYWPTRASNSYTELFAATVRAGSVKTDSVFTPDTFREFKAQGVTSYGISIQGGRLTKVNPYKQDDRYEPLVVVSCSGTTIDEWLAAGAVRDSAFRTVNGDDKGATRETAVWDLGRIDWRRWAAC
jgi:hypothetical protein